jgi:sugar/nucleoside kinase (ribokinase family)
MSTPVSNQTPSSESPRFDVCVIGHVTRDIFPPGCTREEGPGGTAYYSSLALKRMGLNVAVVTKTAVEDREDLIGELEREEVAVLCGQSRATSTFENLYGSEGPDRRVQHIRAVSDPFSFAELEEVVAAFYHLGPLTNEDVPVDLIQALSSRPAFISLDVQGMLRPARIGTVREMDWPEKHKALPHVHLLKADEKEAQILSGEKGARAAAAAIASLGPKEVLVTMGSRGSVVFAGNTLHRIPSFRPKRWGGDPTGCGDTYVAGYLCERMKGVSPEKAGRFAAVMATLKLEGGGPFRGSRADVFTRLSDA